MIKIGFFVHKGAIDEVRLGLFFDMDKGQNELTFVLVKMRVDIFCC